MACQPCFAGSATQGPEGAQHLFEVPRSLPARFNNGAARRSQPRLRWGPIEEEEGR
jgi:hypothetical protein